MKRAGSMGYELDKQTISDLEIFGDERSSHSIFSWYNGTKTNGGKDRLYDLMRNPLEHLEQLQSRRDAIRFFYDHEIELQISSSQFDFIEHYLRLNIPILRDNILDAYFQGISYKIQPANDYYIIQTGIQQLIFLFTHLHETLQSISHFTLPQELDHQIRHIQAFIEHPDTRGIFTEKHKINWVSVNRYDNLFRKKYRNEIYHIIQIIYSLDAFIALAKAAKTHQLSFPEYLSASTPQLTITGLFHPLLAKAVPYDVEMDETKNVCFLTGPNMAGKSTFLKSLGLSIYLAHLGFPVPAAKMKTTIYNGIITTINLSDNISKGYSHFYSEVKRVKETALKIKEKGKIFVIFDELFRGTNVKDAFDASLLIIQSFAKIKSCSFYISTHITEVAEEVKSMENLLFKYFDSELMDDKPIYNYKLLNGVSYERLGMLIVKNEKIIEILNSITDE